MAGTSTVAGSSFSAAASSSSTAGPIDNSVCRPLRFGSGVGMEGPGSSRTGKTRPVETMAAVELASGVCDNP